MPLFRIIRVFRVRHRVVVDAPDADTAYRHPHTPEET